jgi:hypothetical protein
MRNAGLLTTEPPMVDPGARSPRTATVMHAAELADRCRGAASLLEAVATGASSTGVQPLTASTGAIAFGTSQASSRSSAPRP